MPAGPGWAGIQAPREAEQLCPEGRPDTAAALALASVTWGACSGLSLWLWIRLLQKPTTRLAQSGCPEALVAGGKPGAGRLVSGCVLGTHTLPATASSSQENTERGSRPPPHAWEMGKNQQQQLQQSSRSRACLCQRPPGCLQGPRLILMTPRGSILSRPPDRGGGGGARPHFSGAGCTAGAQWGEAEVCLLHVMAPSSLPLSHPSLRG